MTRFLRRLALPLALLLVVPALGAVNTVSASASYVGNGGTTAFPTGFQFFSATDLVVTSTPSGGSTTTMHLGTDYNVSGGNDAPGTVTMVSAPAAATTIVITRSTPATQPTSLPVAGPFVASSVEQMGDRTALGLQETQLRASKLEARMSAVETTQSALGQTTVTTIPAFISVKAAGAKGDAITDDTVAIQSAINTAQAAGGGTVFFPNTGKAYRVTAQLLVGVRFVTEGDVVLGGPTYPSDPSFSLSNGNIAFTMPYVALVGEPGAAIWTDYSPSVDTAAIYYGVRGGTQINPSIGEVRGLTFYAQPEMSTGGTVTAVPGENAITATHAVGVFAAGSTVSLTDLRFVGYARAVVLDSCYWSKLAHIFIMRATDGILLNGMNASRSERLQVNYAHRAALIVSGQGIGVQDLWTEQCAVDLWATQTDQFFFKGAYLEDTNVSRTDYSIKFGFENWRSTHTYVAGAYVTNGSNTYLTAAGGTSGSSGGPTGTGTSISDGSVTWAYVNSNNGTVQNIWAQLENIHGSKAGGKHIFLANSEVQAIDVRLYQSNAGSKSWADDTNSYLQMINCNLPLDLTSDGFASGDYSVLSENSFQNQGGFSAGQSAADLTGAKTSGLQLGSEWLWYDATDGIMRWRHGTPSDQHDGNSLAPEGNSATWSSFPSTATGSFAVKTITWYGNLGDVVHASPSGAALPDGVFMWAQVTAANTIKLYVYNLSGGTFNPGNVGYNLSLWQAKH